MIDMMAWTTPSVIVEVEGFDLSDYQCVITIEQMTKGNSIRASVTVDGNVAYDGTNSYVSATLTQEQTGLLTDGWATVTVNGIEEGGNRVGVLPIKMEVERNPHDEVMTYA